MDIMPDIRDQKEIFKIYYEPSLSKPFMSERVYNELTLIDNKEPAVFAKDYDRIKKAKSFIKLEEKQIFIDKSLNKVLGNKITENLRLSQISRTIASRFGYSKMDIYAIGAAALLNNLGSPPFESYGEVTLNNLCKDIGGFCLSAQTIRIATNVETLSSDFLGLNLTYRVLLGAVKSHVRFNPNNYKDIDSSSFITKSFIYDEEYLMLDRFIKNNNIKVRTMDTQIIGISEKIIKSVYKLNDALKKHLLYVDDIIPMLSKCSNIDSNGLNKIKNVIENSKSKCSIEMKGVDNVNYSDAVRKTIVAELIEILINDITLLSVNDEHKNITFTTWDKELDFNIYNPLIKSLNVCINKLITADVSTVEHNKKGARAIEKLFGVYYSKPNYLPTEFRADTVITKYGAKPSTTKVDFQKRLAADYISNMTETELFDSYKKLYGEASLGRL